MYKSSLNIRPHGTCDLKKHASHLLFLPDRSFHVDLLHGDPNNSSFVWAKGPLTFQPLEEIATPLVWTDMLYLPHRRTMTRRGEGSEHARRGQLA
jgi:hypothetical protein